MYTINNISMKKAVPEYSVNPFLVKKVEIECLSSYGSERYCSGSNGKFLFGISLKFVSIQKLVPRRTIGASLRILKALKFNVRSKLVGIL